MTPPVLYHLLLRREALLLLSHSSRQNNCTLLHDFHSAFPCTAELSCMSSSRLLVLSSSASAFFSDCSILDQLILFDAPLRDEERLSLDSLDMERPAAQIWVPATVNPVKKSPAPRMVMQKVSKLAAIDTDVATTSRAFFCLCESALCN
jgi:hypothetical protein